MASALPRLRALSRGNLQEKTPALSAPVPLQIRPGAITASFVQHQFVGPCMASFCGFYENKSAADAYW